MPSTYTGYPGAVRYKGRWQFDPVTGDLLEHTWNGPKRPIFALYAGFRKAGIRAVVEHRGPLYTLTADIGSLQDGNETPQDEWEIDHEFIQSSIFNVPEVTAEAREYVSAAQYKRDLEEAVRTGKTNPIDTNNFPLSDLVYLELSRGNETTEIDRIVLRRVRHFSNAYAQRVVLTTIPKVYSTAALIKVFTPVPDVIQRQLPETPVNTPETPFVRPVNTFWGWKVRRDKSTPVPRLNKIKEEKEWVFAAWARLNNQPVLDDGEVLPPLDT